jgi:thioredoxin-like negative regulator of GroEL
VKIYKIDKDKLYSLIENYDINLIPAFLLLKNGQEIMRLEGDSNLAALSEKIKQGLEAPTLQKRSTKLNSAPQDCR